MKTISNLGFKLAVLTMLILALSYCSQKPSADEKYTLASAFDSIVFNPFNINEDDFFLSCFALQEVMQRKLPELEINSARYLAKELRVVIATGRVGKFGISHSGDSVSLRKIWGDFAKVWDVTILIDGNTIMVIDHFDIDRFPHEIVIKGNEK